MKIRKSKIDKDEEFMSMKSLVIALVLAFGVIVVPKYVALAADAGAGGGDSFVDLPGGTPPGDTDTYEIKSHGVLIGKDADNPSKTVEFYSEDVRYLQSEIDKLFDELNAKTGG